MQHQVGYRRGKNLEIGATQASLHHVRPDRSSNDAKRPKQPG
jgi:hypothetical protein